MSMEASMASSWLNVCFLISSDTRVTMDAVLDTSPTRSKYINTNNHLLLFVSFSTIGSRFRVLFKWTFRYYFVSRKKYFRKSFWLISKLQLGELLMMYKTLSFNCHHDFILRRLSISRQSSHRRVRGWRRAPPRTSTRSCPRCAGSPPSGSRTAPPPPPPPT